MIVKCKYCDKEFNIRPSAYKKSKTKIFYCCKEHMNKDKILKSKEFHDINNGITLCQDCHALEHPYISRDEKGRFISRSGPKSTEDPE